MEKKNIILWVAIGLLVAGFVWLAVWGDKTTVVVNEKGQVIETLGGVANIKNVGSEFGMNGLQTIVQSGDFINSTTTIVSILNPFPATSTVSFIGLFNSGVATTSYNINCGNTKTASAPNVSSNPGVLALQTVNIATSSIFSQELRMASSSPTYIAPSGYLLCVAHGAASNDAIDAESNAWYNAFTNTNNTFDGSFWVEFKGLIK